MKKNIITTILLSATLMLGATNAMAENSTDVMSNDKQHQKMNVKKLPAGHFKLDLFNGIQLNDEQKSEIKAIRKEYANQKLKGQKSTLRELKKMYHQITDLTFSDDYSKEKVKSLVNGYLVDIEKRVIEQSEVENKVFNVLTSDQKIKYRENLKNIEKRFERFENEKRRKFHVEAVGSDGTIYTKDTIIR